MSDQRPLPEPAGTLEEERLLRQACTDPYRQEQPGMNQPMLDTLGRLTADGNT